MGTNFFGFQSQVGKPTIQDNLEKRLKNLFRRRIVVFGCGRTDRGVHAKNYVFHIDLLLTELARFDLEFLKNHLSRPFPVKLSSPEIVVKDIKTVSNDFDARFSCVRKTYTFYFSLKQIDPFFAPYCWSLPETYRSSTGICTNFENFNKGITLLQGYHNFIWLVIVNENEQRDYRRDLKISFREVPVNSLVNEEKCFELGFETDFFLHRMVRRLTGLLINVLLNKVDINLLQDVLNHFDNSTENFKARDIPLVLNEIKSKHETLHHISDLLNTAPAKGLFLEKVEYD